MYQRWIYRVDPSRVNEYGVSQEMLEVRQQQNGSVNAIEPALAAEEEIAAAEPKAPEEKKNE